MTQNDVQKRPENRPEKVPKRVLADLWALLGGPEVQQEPQEAENYPKLQFWDDSGTILLIRKSGKCSEFR